MKPHPNRESAIINMVIPDEDNNIEHLFDFVYDVEAERDNINALIHRLRFTGGRIHSISRFNWN